MSLQDNRREYTYGELSRESLASDPFAQFKLWMDQALAADIIDPTAMSLSTLGADGKLWSRMVLLKGFDHRGLVFYTNLGSRKALDIDSNSQVCLHFPWLQMDRQVIVAGRAERLGDAEVEKYFASRPRASQLAAWASQQSTPIESRQQLQQQYDALEQKYTGAEIPLPNFWGGYLVVPSEMEFWQGGENRLHDRFRYALSGDQWQITRLSP
jgi:pyridoxamine 5'-phosphate oxidase